MKFNPEIARDILLDIEELHQNSNPFVFSSSDVFNRAKKYDLNTIVYHCDKLKEAHYIDWQPQYASDKLYLGFINGLTYDGHQFLDSIRDPKIWRKTKERASKIGVFTIDVISQITSNVISELITNKK